MEKTGEQTMSTSGYLAIDIGGTEIKWALFDNQLKINKRASYATSQIKDTDTLINSLQPVINQLPELKGIGVSVPATVKLNDLSGEVIGGGALPFLDHVALGTLVKNKYQVPVAVLNDGKCGVLGEYTAGPLVGCTSGIVLALGTGVGGGIIINGQLLEGFHSFAGEFSFLRCNMDQPFSMENVIGGRCSWLSLKALILKQKQQEDQPTITGKTLFDWIEQGDKEAIQGLNDYARQVALLILQLQAVIDPQRFVIAGGISVRPALSQAICQQVEQVLQEIPFKQIPHPTVVQATLGNDANLYGAAVYLKQQLMI